MITKYRKELMGFAALWILFYNCWIITNSVGSIGYKIIHFLKITGICGVDIFLFLSGIGLMYSMAKHNWLDFYKRRLSRVFLPMVIIAIVYALVNNWSLVTTLKNLFGITFYTKTINTFLWFAISIMSIYIVFPLYYKLISKLENKFLFFAVLIIIWYIFSISNILSNRGDLYQFTNRLPIFFLGTIYTDIQNKVKLKKPTINILGILGLLAGLQLFYFVYYKGMSLIVPKPIFFIPCILISLSLCILLPNLFELCRGHFKIILSIFGIIGGISFELYCVQSLIVKIASKYIMITNKLMLNLLLVVFIAIACTILYITSNLIRLAINKIKIDRY